MDDSKKKSILRKKLLFLSIIFFFLLCLNSINFSTIENNTDQKDNNMDNKDNADITELNTQDLEYEDQINTYNGIGDSWNVTHWANRTDLDIPIEFDEVSSDMTEMPLGYGWNGYKMEAVVHDLYDKRNWVNGTFDEGPDDGSESAGDDDSSYVLNWSFGSVST